MKTADLFTYSTVWQIDHSVCPGLRSLFSQWTELILCSLCDLATAACFQSAAGRLSNKLPPPLRQPDATYTCRQFTRQLQSHLFCWDSDAPRLTKYSAGGTTCRAYLLLTVAGCEALSRAILKPVVVDWPCSLREGASRRTSRQQRQRPGRWRRRHADWAAAAAGRRHWRLVQSASRRVRWDDPSPNHTR